MFLSFKENVKKKILNQCMWKFNLDTIKLDENKVKYNIEEMSWETPLNEVILPDIYSWVSIHSHSGYISLLQNQQITNEMFLTIKNVSLGFSNHIIARMIDDYSKIIGIDKFDSFNSIDVFIKYKD